MSRVVRSEPIPINGDGYSKIKYQRVPSFYVPPPQRYPSLDPVLEEKKRRIKKIYRYKLVSNFFRFLYFVASLLIIFSPHVWNKNWSFSINDKNFKIVFFSVVGGSIVINLLNSWLHYFYINIFLTTVDIFKFVVCAKIAFIEKKLSHYNHSDSLKEFGYILCAVFLIIDTALIFTTYKIYNLYNYPKY